MLYKSDVTMTWSTDSVNLEVPKNRFNVEIFVCFHFYYSPATVPAAIWIQVKNFRREIYSLFDLRVVSFSFLHISTKFNGSR